MHFAVTLYIISIVAGFFKSYHVCNWALNKKYLFCNLDTKESVNVMKLRLPRLKCACVGVVFTEEEQQQQDQKKTRPKRGTSASYWNKHNAPHTQGPRPPSTPHSYTHILLHLFPQFLNLKPSLCLWSWQLTICIHTLRPCFKEDRYTEQALTTPHTQTHAPFPKSSRATLYAVNEWGKTFTFCSDRISPICAESSLIWICKSKFGLYVVKRSCQIQKC